MFCASDIGWVVGHSYILYGPLLVGATTVMFEGKPVGTPDAGTFWRVIERTKANVLFTAPTALRAIRKDDPDNKYFKEVGDRGGLKSLRALFLAGERSEPSIVQNFQDLLTKQAAPGAVVIDNWWSSESGSPITGLALRSDLGYTPTTKQEKHQPPFPIKPGSAGKPMPGFDVRVVDDDGHEVKRGTMGNIVLAIPLAPTAFRTLFNDEERFYKSYLLRFNGRWVDTGDAGMIDQDGYVHIMSRSDDIINVAAHRFSTGSSSSLLLLSCDLILQILTNNTNRRNRAGHPLPPPHRRSKRNRHPGPNQRPPPLRIRATPAAIHQQHQTGQQQWKHPSNTTNPTLQRNQRSRPRPNRRHRLVGRHHPGCRHDPQNPKRKDTTPSVEGIS